MHYLRKPTPTVKNVIQLCDGRFVNRNHSDCLLNACQTLERLENEYCTAGDSGTLHTPSSTTGDTNTDQLLIKVYKQKMAQSSGSARAVYDEIKIGARDGICAYCGASTASTLDHFLSKGKSPCFAITPVNLIPACYECNHAKDERRYLTQQSLNIHPYFDNVENLPWLYADFIPDKAILTYSAKPDRRFSQQLAIKIENTFRDLKLASMYRCLSAQAFAGMRMSLVRQQESGGFEAVQKYLYDEFESSKAAALNGWRTAMLRAMYRSDWFFQGGFLQIPIPQQRN